MYKKIANKTVLLVAVRSNFRYTRFEEIYDPPTTAVHAV